MLDEYRIEPLSVGQYLDRVDNEDIKIDQAVQRSFCWNKEMMNALIYSALSRKIYIPNFILAEERRDDCTKQTYVVDALFKGAVENDYLQKNPAENLRLKRRNNDSEDRRVLTREEQRIFKEYAKNTLYNNAYCLVLETGLRAGEIGGLKWDDIDLENKIINVQRTILQDAKKGGFYFGEPKTKKVKEKYL